MYTVKKKIKGKDYWYLRKSERKGQKVVSKTIAYLGKTRKQAEEKFRKIIEERAGKKILRILFICKGNKFRSKVAEILFNKYNKDRFIESKSAGTEPAEPAKKEIVDKIKKEFGIKKINIKPIKLDDNLIKWADVIVIVADNVSLDLKNKKVEKWDIPDTKEENYKEVVRIIKLIDDKVKDLIEGVKNKDVQEEKMQRKKLTIDELASFCKRKGFVFKSSEIYGGFAGFWDFGALGVELYNNIKQDWWNFFVREKENMTGIDSSIISHPRTWKASGHEASFSDISVKCKKCKKPGKIDKNEAGKAKCECGGEYEIIGDFNLMFKTNIGTDTYSYLRPETAQGMFLDFKLVQETSRKQLPFGIAQIGKCFRNEIAPRDFLFRSREFTIAELEFFIHPEEKKCSLLNSEHLNLKFKFLDKETQAQGKEELKETSIVKMLKEKRLEEWHAYWLAEQMLWFKKLGLEEIKIREHMKNELSHYSSATFDIDYEYPFGSKEIAGIANRGQYDLTQHEKESGEKLEIYDEASKEKVIPRVIEPTFGIERVFLALLCKAYNYDSKRDNIVLKLLPKLAPLKVAIFPIVKDEKFVKIAKDVFNELKKEFACIYDSGGSVGRRYARQDEVGTVACITVDGDSLKDHTVTVRDRDTTEQVRVKITELRDMLRKVISDRKSILEFGKKVNTRVK